MNILSITHALNALLIFALVIGLVTFLNYKFRLGWRLYFIGAATFILSQIGHIPFNSAVNTILRNAIGPPEPTSWKLVFYTLYLGLSAGLWEEIARYVMYRWWAKDARSWRKGLALGAGHGGVEAIAIGVLGTLSYINMVALRGVDLTHLVPAEQFALAQRQISAYWSMDWTYSLLGAVERAFTLPAHLAFSIIVLQAFTRRQSRWLWIAVGWHAALDATVVFLANTWAGFSWGVYAVEGILGILALVCIGIVFALRQPEAEPAPLDERPPLPEVKTALQLLPVEDTPENLDNTRYN